MQKTCCGSTQSSGSYVYSLYVILKLILHITVHEVLQTLLFHKTVEKRKFDISIIEKCIHDNGLYVGINQSNKLDCFRTYAGSSVNKYKGRKELS